MTLRLASLVLSFGGASLVSLSAAPAPAPDSTNMATQPAPPAGSNKIAPPPPLPTDDFTRYGKILSPSSQAPYPFKLTMPFPGFGEVKVPRPEELAMRQKLEQLATLSDQEIHEQLEQWPAFGKMSLGDQGSMLTRIQQFRDYRKKIALMKARQLGLFTLNPAQQARFEQEYWNQQLQMDHRLAQQFEPAYRAAQEKLNEELFRKFSSPAASPPPVLKNATALGAKP